MSERTQALLISLALIVSLGGWYSSTPGEFALFSPGPTVNLLGQYDDKQIIDVSGHKAYRDKGELRLVTIRTSRAEDRVGLFRALQAWADPDIAVYPYSGIYQPADTNESTQAESAQAMTSSQDAATAAALDELDIDYATGVGIVSVTKAGPSDGVLRAGDRILAVDGTRMSGTDEVVKTIKAKAPGSQVQVQVRRGKQEISRTLTTEALGKSGDEARQSRIGVTIRQVFDFPFDIKVNLDETIGGPSAGMMFALSIIDVLTPGSMTGGKAIAGTGEIDVEGRVGAIGGVQQKIAGAEEDGAHLFLVPADNCDEAAEAHWDPDAMKLARVATLEEAVDVIEQWVADPDATLPTCEAGRTGE